MPKRTGKTEQSWPDDNGIESFVLASDIRFGGRDLVLTGHIEAASHSLLQAKVQTFVDAINDFSDLVPLVTPDDTFQVLLADGFKSEFVGEGFASLVIKFREPDPNFTGTLGTGSGVASNGIDDFDFYNDYKIRITTISGRFDLPKMKPFKPVQYESEAYNIGRFESSNLTVRGYCEDLTKIPNLYSLLSSAFDRSLSLAYDKDRECYVRDGCKVDKDNFIEMNFRLCDPILEVQYLCNESDELILTNSGFKIIVL